jgi:hypothetical protein
MAAVSTPANLHLRRMDISVFRHSDQARLVIVVFFQLYFVHVDLGDSERGFDCKSRTNLKCRESVHPRSLAKNGHIALGQAMFRLYMI